VALLGTLGLIAGILAACGPTATPTQAPAQATQAPEAAAPTTAPEVVAPTTAPAPAGGPQRGGVLKHALATPGNLDPAFLNSISDDEIGRQWHDFFVYVDEDNQPDPERSLAASWKSNPDGTVWDFELRQGVKFHDGKELTAEDILFTFNRLRDEKIGAATVSLYANIADIKAVDDYNIQFTLKTSNPDFLLDLGDYHALVMDSNTKDFVTEFNGTGPWMIDSYLPEDRLVFKANPNYWMMGEDGKPLPYMDGMEYIFLNEASAQVEALRGGQVDWINYVDPEFVEPLKGDPDIVVATKTGNFHYAIHLRSDRKPADDVRVRQAIKLATDRQAILDTVALGMGTIGHDTPIGPSYGDFYLNAPDMERDVEKAKALLAEAGYPDGVTIELATMNALSAPAIATVWKEQLAEAGITVDIKTMPVDVYYTDVWLESDFGITDWGGRPYPQPYLQLAYMSDSPWSSSHFQDKELDELAVAAGKELDHAKRVEYYHQVQEILMDRGGVIVPFFQDGILAYRANVKPGIAPAALAAAEDLRRVWLEQP
jgi:peptide/nickel transport system substrate-binding protein